MTIVDDVNQAAIEEWRPTDFDKYEVSNFGRVRSFKGRRCRIMSVWPNTKGYMTVGLYCDGNATDKKVHQLVAVAFIGPRPEGKEINHKDGNKANNKLSNLEYVTSRENIEHAKRLGLLKFQRTGNLTIPFETVVAIRREWKPGLTSFLARKYGTSRQYVLNLKNGDYRKSA